MPPLGRAREARLAHAVERDGDLAALLDVLDVRARWRLSRTARLDQRLGAAQEALAVGEALAARIEASVDDVHAPPAALDRQPACFTRMYHSTSRRTCRSV